MKRKRNAKRWLKRAAVTAGILAVLLAVLFMILQTPWAKRKIASYLESSLRQLTGFDVTVGRLRGIVPFRLRLDSLALTDDKGPSLSLTDFEVRLAPFALMKGRVHIYEMTASELDVTRLPHLPKKKETAPSEPPHPDDERGLESQLTRWRKAMPYIVVDQLVLKKFSLGEAVLGESAAFKVRGEFSAADPQTQVSTWLEVNRTDDVGQAKLSAKLAGDPASVSLDINIEEPKNGVLANLLRLSESDSLRISLSGRGVVTSWKGNLDINAANLGNIRTAFAAELLPGPIDLAMSNPSLEGSVQLDLWEDERRIDAAASYALADGSLSLSGLSAEAAGGRISGRAAFDVGTWLGEGELQFIIDDFSSITPLVGETLAGSARGKATLYHLEGVQNVDIEAEAENLKTPYGEAERAELKAALTDLLASRKGTANVRITEFRRDQLTVSSLGVVAEADLHSIEFTSNASGHWRDSFEIETRGDFLIGESFELRDFSGRYREIPVKLLNPSMTWFTDAGWTIDGAELEVGQAHVVMSADYAPDWLAANLDFDGLPIDLLQEPGTTEITGSASGRIRLTGPIAKPEAELHLLLSELTPVDPSYADIVPATLLAEALLREGSAWTSIILEEKQAGKTLEAELTAPVDFSLRPFGISLASEGELHGSLSAGTKLDVIAAMVLPGAHRLRGLVTADLSVAGTVDAPAIKGSVRVDRGMYEHAETGTALADLMAETDFALKDGLFSISALSFQGAGSKLTGDMALEVPGWPARPETLGELRGNITVETKLHETTGIVFPEGHALGGELKASLGLAGKINAPEIAGRISVKNGEYESVQSAAILSDLNLDAEFALTESLLSIPGFSVRSSAGTAKGRLTTGAIGTSWKWRPEEQLEGELSVSMNLDKIAPLVLSKDHLAEGNLTADINVVGTVDALEMTGFVKLENGSYEYSPTATSLRDVYVELVPSGSRLHLREFKATDGQKGTVSATGWLDLAPARDFPFSLDLTLNDATLARSDYLTGTVGGTLTASGSAAHALLAGELSSGPVDIQLPERIALDARELEVIEINIPEQRLERIEPGRRTPVLDVGLDLGIALPRRVFVRGGGLDSEWTGAFRIEGTTAAPIITGTITIVRGHIDFAGRRFRLTGGTVTFGPEVPPVPRLDITAESAAGDITAILKLSGPVSSPTLVISSDPPMPSNEVLARVLFGESVAKITPLQALRLAHVVNTLAGGGDGFAVIARTRKIMKLDRLSLEQSDESLAGTAITAGKYLKGDIYVEVKKGISDKDAGVSFEKQLTPKISVKSELDTTGGKGLRIKWKRDY